MKKYIFITLLIFITITIFAGDFINNGTSVKIVPASYDTMIVNKSDIYVQVDDVNGWINVYNKNTDKKLAELYPTDFSLTTSAQLLDYCNDILYGLGYYLDRDIIVIGSDTLTSELRYYIIIDSDTNLARRDTFIYNGTKLDINYTIDE